MAASPSSSSGRRVLSDQSTNAYLRHFRGCDEEHDLNSKTIMSTRMEGLWGLWRFGSGGVKFEREDDIKDPKIGQKRSIAWVDGTDECDCLVVGQGRKGVLAKGEGEEVKGGLKKEEEEFKAEVECEVKCALKKGEEENCKTYAVCEGKGGLKKEEECKSEADSETRFAPKEEKSDAGSGCDIKPAPKKEDDIDTESACDVKPAPVKEEVNAPEPSSTRLQAMTIAMGGEDDAPRKEEHDLTETSSTESNPTTINAILTSFHASQEGLQPLEEQFDIQDEASQMTLEKLVSRNVCASMCVQ